MFRLFELDNNEEDKEIKENEIIVLTHLKNFEYYSFNEYSYRRKKYKKIDERNKTKEEIEKEIAEEVKKIKDRSLKTHYKIDNQKVIELEKTFKMSKLKVYLDKPINLGNGNICSNNGRKITIYENKYFNILFNIEFEGEIKSVIQLDNNDLIFVGKNNNTLYICRLKDNKYSLFQTIKEDIKGYRMKVYRSGCLIHTKYFGLNWIKKLSNNKFMTISNYGFKIYSLNSSNKYTLILMDNYLEGISKIYEINENNFIFCVDIKGLLEKIELKTIKSNEIEKKLDIIKEEEEENYYYYNSNNNNEEKNELNNIKKNIQLLKFTHFSKVLFDYRKDYKYGYFERFSDFVILKNKYFLIMADNNILIYNIEEGKNLKEYTILEENKNLYIYKNIKIKKWNNIDDNEFIMIDEGNIFLFELNENSQNNIELSIIAYSYFPQINDLTKMNEENRFYVNNKSDILIY